MASSDAKSQAIASADWRRPPPAMQSPGPVVEGTSAAESSSNPGKCHNPYSQHALERESLSLDKVSYRRPKDGQAPWEMVLSAPAGKSLLSPPLSAPTPEDKKATLVQFKTVSPLVVNVNGEEITLPNRFSIDVVPIDSESSPSGQTSPFVKVGELTRLETPTSFRRVLSDDSDGLLDELQGLCSDADISSSVTSASSDGDIVGYTVISSEGCHTRRKPSKDEETRFQMMLSRLQNNAQPPALASKTSDVPTQPSRIVDPAIIAMKIKEDVGAPGSSGHGRTQTGAANGCTRQQIHFQWRPGYQRSADSGYSTNSSGHGGSGPSSATSDHLATDLYQRLKESSASNHLMKQLNPAAAEFRSTTQQDDIPQVSPRKMTRIPLSTIFPNAIVGRSSHQPAISSQNNQAGPSRQAGGSAAEQQTPTSLENGSINCAYPPEASIPVSQAVLQPPGLGVAANGTLPYALLPVESLPRQVVPPMQFPATLSTATVPPAPLVTNHGIFPPAAMPSASISVPAPGLPIPGGFNTFPLSSGNPVPAFSQPAAAGVRTGLGYGAEAHQQPLFNTTGRVNRPYFPVTQKPRDHDPVRQQMYEAYLEWRKANEPGYHMRCKMRQAQRVLRQCQQKQEQDDNAA
ncbi:hypothetical protein VTK56DRAFT_1388 [Thermocarpiscus australiensis]